MEIFRFKFSALGSEQVKEYVQLYEMGYKPIHNDQKEELRLELTSSVDNIDNIDFYKVSFLAVLDLVRQRRCFLKGGFAYVSSADFGSIIGNHHQKFIDQGLASVMKILPELENDDRIVGIIKNLHNSYIGKDYTINKDADVPIESLNQLSLKSFPPCMRSSHEYLRSTHHLKYFGRLQYGLFLKGIGVTLEDSIRFWREEFIKIVDPDKFDKNYAYGIRYNYGKEGSRTNWTPWSCIKVINQHPAAQDTCGCPFKLWDPIEMRNKLINYGANPVNVQDVVSLASKGHFQLACGRYFEITHNTTLDEGINHPNGYFENSQIVMGNREAKQKTTQSPQQSQHNQQMKVAMSQQLAFKQKQDAKKKAEQQEDDALWELSQRETELLEELKVKEQKRKAENLEVSMVESMQWDEDEDDMEQQLSNYL